MVYKPNIPQSSDFISQSQKDMIGNFETANEIWGKLPEKNENVGDHIPLTNAQTDEQGLHKKISLIEQSSEPAPSTNEVTLFTKDNSGTPEIFYRRDGDAAGLQLTSLKGINNGGLVLRAFVVFDSQANIQTENQVVNGVTTSVPLSYNIASVVSNQAGVDGLNISSDWTITFANALPTADYIWDYQAFVDPRVNVFFNTKSVQAQPFNSGTYADTVTTTSFRAWGTNLGGNISPAGPVIGRLVRMVFQAFTVA